VFVDAPGRAERPEPVVYPLVGRLSTSNDFRWLISIDPR